MRKLVLAALAATTLSTPAMAQDAPPPFTGLRVEGVVGYDVLKDGSGQDSGESEGLLYGGQVGYDFRTGGVVLGIEGEATGSTTDTRATGLLVPNDVTTLDAGRDLYVGGRVGALLSPVAMVYAKGGYTNAQVDVDYRAGNSTTRFKSELDGFRVGAGLEYQLNPGMYVKGEYRYSNYSSIDGYDTDLDRHQLLGGIGIRF